MLKWTISIVSNNNNRSSNNNNNNIPVENVSRDFFFSFLNSDFNDFLLLREQD